MCNHEGFIDHYSKSFSGHFIALECSRCGKTWDMEEIESIIRWQDGFSVRAYAHLIKFHPDLSKLLGDYATKKYTPAQIAESCNRLGLEDFVDLLQAATRQLEEMARPANAN